MFKKSNNEVPLRFEDVLAMKDNKTLRGRVIIRDDFGNIILEKDNLIVMRGRTFALESLFKDPIDPAVSGYKVNMNRSVCLFKIGGGGADVKSAPFQPFTPSFSDEDLAAPVPFVIQDPGKYDAVEKENNPSIIEVMSTKQKAKYYLPNMKSDGTTEYYGKVFETDPQWVFNKETNEVYKKIMLRINSDEARGYMINELGLVLAEFDSANNLYKDAELFSRITFDTKSLTSLTENLLIEYLVFA
jgi:hypothetical protein